MNKEMILDPRRLLRLPFLYDSYQKLVGVHAARRRLFEQYLSFPKGCRVLDIGCGAGEVLDALPTGVKYIGFDSNLSYIKRAKKKYSEHTFICRDINNTKAFLIDKFDVIIMFGVLHHLNDEEVRRAFRFAKSHLAPHGIVITVDGVYLAEQRWLTRFILSKDRGQYTRFDNEYANLAEEIFPSVKTYIERNVLRIPTDYIIMKLSA